MIYTVYYSVVNCGDGSAYPEFFTNERCAEIHQELGIEGWGEDCTGSLDVESDSPVKFDAMTVNDFIQQLQEDLDDEVYDEPDVVKDYIDELSRIKE